ncbi:biliverdin-producing heme oxygenase [Desulfogranum marinum]|uniref:biliverdin-producing heme oxygenase n=1 Tax=Desulfogranum marinum TaxID=453220 RepID=UPI0029C7F1A6|nr:biliverdin-producing heme oxygenase [Desulfogranum marinum]
MEIMAILKAETADYHVKLESLPYFCELIAHRLPLECYVNQLRALSVVHSVLEDQLATSTNQQILSVWNDDLRKLPLLLEDLLFFEPRVCSDNIPSIDSALSMVEKIRLISIERPLSLLGYLYVMEGSTLGNYMHQPDITESYHLGGLNGSQYYAGYKDKVRIHWQQFADKMNRVISTPALYPPIIEGAHETFIGLEKLYRSLFPLKKSNNTFHVARINPEAGNHPIPTDKREIQAALNASNRCWSEYPYYEKRYGKRGKRFSDSDTCWLATLTALDQIALQKQIDWLCRVLAARGMPSLLLESLLYYLSQELTTAVPENKGLYQKLLISADRLKLNRLKKIEEQIFRNLAEEFDQFVELDMRNEYKKIGFLLVSAVVDENNGIPEALNSLHKWLVDSDRFPDGWIAAVEKTINKATSIVSE